MSSKSYPKIVLFGTVLAALILVLVPFHALITVWLGSSFGHYTAWRLWDEVALVLVSICAVVVCFYHKLWHKLYELHVVWLISAYAVLQVTIGLIAWLKHDVTAKALGYGWIVDLRYLLFFVACLVLASRSDWLKKHWQQLLLIPAAIVVVFGLAQVFILPADFLRHFGYGPATIPPFETVNHNIHYIRIQSTLRGVNPLGAYLVIIISALTAVFIRAKDVRWRTIYGLFLAASLAVLFYSYSRSALAGAMLGAALIVWVSIKNNNLRRWLLGIATVLVIVFGMAAFALRNNTTFENVFTHTQQHSAVKTTSDQNHLSYLKSGLKDAVHQPLGRGPGTAGPASFYNNGQPRIAENYFVQIAQEVGWLGLVIFLLILWLVAKGLWLDRMDSLSLMLLASLAGITFVNLFSHAWADDTLSYIWWGLAGIALASTLKTHDKAAKKSKR